MADTGTAAGRPGAAGERPSAVNRLRVFISYARNDTAFANELEGGLSLLGYEVFIDRHLSGGEAWKQSLANHIAQADTIVFVLSPSSIDSEMCQWEVDRATELSKRILPVVVRDMGDRPVPERLRELNYIFFTPPNSFVGKLGDLRDALDRNLDWIREHTRYLDLATRWAAAADSSTPTGRLLMARSDIAAAQKWLADWQRPNPEPTETQRAFIAASAAHADAEAAARQRALEERERLAREKEDAAARAFAEAERAEAEAARAAEASKGREAALAQAEKAAAETARSQRRAGRLLWGVLALVVAMLGGAMWQSRQTEMREAAVFTQLATIAMSEERHDRAMRFAVQAFPPVGALPWAPFSTELEGRLAGAAMLTRQTGVSTEIVGRGERVTRFSRDGRHAIVSHTDGPSRVVEPLSGRVRSNLAGHSRFVLAAAFSADGKRAATTSFDGTLRIWEVDTGRNVATFQDVAEHVSEVALSADGKLVAAGGRGQSARVWDVDARKETLPAMPIGGDVRGLAFSPDGARLAVASDNKRGVIFDLPAGSEAFRLDGHTNGLRSVIFSGDGKVLITTSADHTARIWDAANGAEFAVLRGHGATVWQAQLGRDEALLATTSFDRTVRLWSLETLREVAVLKGHGADVRHVAFDAEGKTVVTAALDDTVRFWSVSGAEVASFHRHRAALTSVAFSFDGRRALTGSEDKSARVWDAGTGAELRVHRPTRSSVLAVAFSPDSKSAIVGSAEAGAVVWSQETGAATLLGSQNGRVIGAAYSPDGSRMLTAGADNLRLWDTASGAAIAVLDGDGTGISGISIGPSSRFFAFVTLGGRLIAGDARTGRIRLDKVLEGPVPTSLSFSPDETLVVLGDADQSIRLVDSGSGKEMGVMKGHTDWVRSASFSPDGRRLGSTADDRTMRFWDARSLKEIVAVRAHEGPVPAGAFSPDGKRFASAGADAVARVWDTSWLTVYGGKSRDRVCAEKLAGVQEFSDEELADPILRGIDASDPVARNPCLRRGPLSLDYWTRLPGQVWRAIAPRP